MQAAKKAVENVKETAANIGASAKAGMEKTKANVQEKSEKMSANDPMQKEMATLKKEERIHQADAEKQQAREHNAAVKQSANADHIIDQNCHHDTNTNTEMQQAHDHNAAAKLSANTDRATDQSCCNATDQSCHHHTKAATASGYSTIGDYGSGHGQPMATDHVSTIPTLGFGNEVAMGSHSIDTKAKANNVHLGEAQPGSAPAKY